MLPRKITRKLSLHQKMEAFHTFHGSFHRAMKCIMLQVEASTEELLEASMEAKQALIEAMEPLT